MVIFTGNNIMATIYETLEKIDKLKQRKRKVDQLKEAGDFVMLTIIQGAYNLICHQEPHHTK